MCIIYLSKFLYKIMKKNIHDKFDRFSKDFLSKNPNASKFEIEREFNKLSRKKLNPRKKKKTSKTGLNFQEFVKNYLIENTNASEEDARTAFFKKRYDLSILQRKEKFTIKEFCVSYGLMNTQSYYNNREKLEPIYKKWVENRKSLSIDKFIEEHGIKSKLTFYNDYEKYEKLYQEWILNVL